MNNRPPKGTDDRIYKSLNRKSSKSRRIDYGKRDSYPPVDYSFRRDPRRGGANPGTVIAITLLSIIIIVSLVFIVQNRREREAAREEVEATETAAVLETDAAAEQTTELESLDASFVGPPAVITEAPAPDHDTVTKSAADVYKGSLILVNADHEYHFPDAGEQTITTVYGNKSANYRVSDTTVALDGSVLTILNTMIDDFYAATGKNDVLIRSGYRDYQMQVDIYNERVESQGELAAAMYVANPGCSEHHTGWAMDLSVYTYDGDAFTFDYDETYLWITENCPLYGFILRYPADKVSCTGIAYEPWHFRWVGTPSAAIITENGWCLEEYITYLAENTSFEGEHLAYTDASGVNYEVYYVPASTEGDTEIPVPTGCDCSISGDNCGGFIVTATVAAI